MTDVGVVVLNYNRYDETIRCVESLLTQSDINLKIVIVENGSSNESLERLEDKFEDFSNITLLSSDENLGFAKGMNLGIDHLRSENVGFIFLANSDLIFTEQHILYDMLKMNKPGVGVICPFIQNTDGSYGVNCSFKKKLLWARICKTFIEGEFKWFKRRIIKKRYPDGKSVNLKPKPKPQAKGRENIVLTDKFVVTGSGYMYTPQFFEVYSRMYPCTFLYNEEYATCLYLQKAGLSTAWADTKPIIHKHGASTPAKSSQSKEFVKKIHKGGRRTIIRLMFMSKEEIIKRYC